MARFVGDCRIVRTACCSGERWRLSRSGREDVRCRRCRRVFDGAATVWGSKGWEIFKDMHNVFIVREERGVGVIGGSFVS